MQAKDPSVIRLRMKKSMFRVFAVAALILTASACSDGVGGNKDRGLISSAVAAAPVQVCALSNSWGYSAGNTGVRATAYVECTQSVDSFRYVSDDVLKGGADFDTNDAIGVAMNKARVQMIKKYLDMGYELAPFGAEPTFIKR